MKAAFQGTNADDRVWQFMGFDNIMVVSKALDVQLLDSNTAPGTCLKPAWLWRAHSTMAAEMAHIVSTMNIAKQYGKLTESHSSGQISRPGTQAGRASTMMAM